MNRTQMPGNFHNLQVALEAGTPVYVLIDALVGEPIFIDRIEHGVDPRALREAVWKRPVQRIALHESCKLPIHLHPYLVRLDGITDPLLELTIDLANAERRDALENGLDGDGTAVHRIGGWLQSSMTPMELSSHMASMLRVRTAAITKFTYLRLVDRRTLALLCHVAGVGRVEAQMGRLQCWVFLDIQGNLAVLHSSDERPRPLRLSNTEWKTMQDGIAFNRALAQWLGEAERIGERDTLGRAAHELYAPLGAALQSAKLVAFEHPGSFPTLGDQTVWAALSMLQSSLPHSPAVRNMLDANRAPDIPSEPFRYIYREAHDLLDAERFNMASRIA